MKKYKIEIWQYHQIVETFESDDIKEVLNWYIENWRAVYDYGGCTFYLYEKHKKLSFDKEYELGFYDFEEDED